MIRIAGGDGYSAVIDPYYRQWAAQNSFEQGLINFYANVAVVSKIHFMPILVSFFPISLFCF
jgi:hypothetical protein